MAIANTGFDPNLDHSKLYFDNTDANHDGYISQDEASQTPDQVLIDNFTVSDADKDGKLSQEEFYAAAAGGPAVKEEFTDLDESKDGQISQAEIDATRVNFRDTDGDQKITKRDVTRFFTREFSRQDKNGDKILDADELKGSFLEAYGTNGKLGLKTVKKIAEKQFGVLDTDKNKILSSAEIDKTKVSAKDYNNDGVIDREEYYKSVLNQRINDFQRQMAKMKKEIKKYKKKMKKAQKKSGFWSKIKLPLTLGLDKFLPKAVRNVQSYLPVFKQIKDGDKEAKNAKKSIKKAEKSYKKVRTLFNFMTQPQEAEKLNNIDYKVVKTSAGYQLYKDNKKLALVQTELDLNNFVKLLSPEERDHYKKLLKKVQEQEKENQ